MFKASFLALFVYLTFGWLSSLATGTLFLDGAPLSLTETPEGRVLVTGGLADYRGLSFFTKDGRLIRHSNYQLVTTDKFPSILNRDIGTLYDATFYLTSADDTQDPPTLLLETSNLAFNRVAAGSPPFITKDPERFAKAEVIFDSSLGPIFLAAGRYRALITVTILLVGLIYSVRRLTISWAWFGGALACYLATWIVAFQPGLFTNDSIRQLTNASNLQFDNMHPPFMALVAAPFLKFLSIGLLVKIQATVGIAGIALLVWQLLQGYEAKRRSVITAAIVCVILSPLFPFTPYLFSFWKDAWAGIATIWIGNIFIWTPRSFTSKLAALFALTGAVLVLTLLRHNSLALAPIWLVVFFITFRKSFQLNKSLAGTLALGLLIPIGLGPSLLDRVLRVTKTDTMNQILLLEILEAQRREPQLAAVTPFTTAQIIDPQWRYSFNLDRNDQLFGWGTPSIVTKKVGTFDYRVAELREEYWAAWSKFPGTMLASKIGIFKALLTRPRSPYANGIIENKLGIRFSDNYAQTRSVLFWATERAWNSSARLLSLPIVQLMLVLAALVFRRSRNLITVLPVAALLGLCLGLYMIYFLACPTAEYRYIFPAILLGHLLAFSAMFILMLPITVDTNGNDPTR